MGEAKRREEAEAEARAAWADDVVADVVALEAAAVRAVFGGRVPDPAAEWSEDQAQRVGYLTALAVQRSVGADLGAFLDDDDDEDDLEDDPDDDRPPAAPRRAFSLVAEPAPSRGLPPAAPPV